MTNEDKIKEILKTFNYNVQDGIHDGGESEALDGHTKIFYTSYSVKEDAEDLLYQIGCLLDIKTLVDLFKKPKTITEIIEDIKKKVDKIQQPCIYDYEELEEIEKTSHLDGYGPRYIMISSIMKYIPNGKFYRFDTHQTNSDNFFVHNIVYNGEVKKQEVTTIEWV